VAIVRRPGSKSPSSFGSEAASLRHVGGPVDLRDAHYTPEVVVDRLVELTLGPLLADRPYTQCRDLLVLDPACGDGAFLVGALRFLCRRYAASAPSSEACMLTAVACLHGIDVDAEALAVADSRIRELAGAPARLAHGDALLGPLDPEVVFADAFERDRPGFDAVIGNPPYVDAEHMARLQPGLRPRIRRRYRSARGNWDLFCPFIERAVDLTREGGRHAFIVPGQIASAEYARAIREDLAERCALDHVIDYADARLFGANVYPIAYVARRGRGAAFPSVRVDRVDADFTVLESTHLPLDRFDSDAWPLSRQAACRLPAGWPQLGEIAEVSGAATVGEAYALLPHIRDRPKLDPSDRKLVNSGTIDPFVSLWGERPMRYLKHRFGHPVVTLDALPPRRRNQAQAPKLVAAGMTRRLEILVDGDGDIIAAKSTTVVQPHAIDRWALGALLNSRAASDVYAARFAGLRLSGGYLRVGPPQLRALPIPPMGQPQVASLAEAARALAKGPDADAMRSIDRIAAELYRN
jgi:Eco57I restriction-modification methylase